MPAVRPILAVLAAAASLAACSSSTGGTLIDRTGSSSAVAPCSDATPSAAPQCVPPTSASSSPTSEAGSSSADGGSDADDSLAAARDYLSDPSHSFELKGTAEMGGAPGSVDLSFGADSSQGQIVIKGGTLQVIGIGRTVYLKGDRAFWEAASPSVADRIMTVLGDKWLSASADDATFASLAEFGTRDGFVGSLLADKAGLTTGEPAVVNGVDCISLRSPSGGTLYLSADDSRPIEIVKGATGKLDFTYAEQPEPTAPDPSEVVPASELGG